MLCWPRVIEMFGWIDQFLFVFGPVPRDRLTKSAMSMRGNMPPRPWPGNCDTRLDGQPNSLESKPKLASDWLHSRK